MATDLELRWETGPHLIKFEHPRPDFCIQAFVDPFPKLPLSFVIAPGFGSEGEKAHISDLSVATRELMVAAQISVAQRLRRIPNLAELVPADDGRTRLLPDEYIRVIELTDGFGVPDHPHVVSFAARRGQGARQYLKTERIRRKKLPVYGPEDVEAFQRLLAFTEEELEFTLAGMRKIADMHLEFGA